MRLHKPRGVPSGRHPGLPRHPPFRLLHEIREPQLQTDREPVQRGQGGLIPAGLEMGDVTRAETAPISQRALRQAKRFPAEAQNLGQSHDDRGRGSGRKTHDAGTA